MYDVDNFKIIKSMEHIRSWETSSTSASRDIPCTPWNPKSHYRVLDDIWARWIQPSPPYFFILSFSSSLVLQPAYFLRILQPKLCINFSSPPCVLHASSIGPILIQINPLSTLQSNFSRSFSTLSSHLRSSFPTIAFFKFLQQNRLCVSVLFQIKIKLIAVLRLDFRSGSFFSPSSCRINLLSGTCVYFTVVLHVCDNCYFRVV